MGRFPLSKISPLKKRGMKRLLEIAKVNLAWKFQGLTFRIPRTQKKRGLVGGSLKMFHSRATRSARSDLVTHAPLVKGKRACWCLFARPQGGATGPLSRRRPQRARGSKKIHSRSNAWKNHSPTHEIFILAWNFHSRFEIFILDWKFQSQALFFCGQRGARNENFILDWKFHSVLKAWFFSISPLEIEFFSILGPSGDSLKFFDLAWKFQGLEFFQSLGPFGHPSQSQKSLGVHKPWGC